MLHPCVSGNQRPDPAATEFSPGVSTVSPLYGHGAGRGFVGVVRNIGSRRYCTSRAEAHGGMKWWKDKLGGARPNLGDWR